MIIDGAMGTMIQQHNLDEDAFRGISNPLHKLPHLGKAKFIFGLTLAKVRIGTSILSMKVY